MILQQTIVDTIAQFAQDGVIKEIYLLDESAPENSLWQILAVLAAFLAVLISLWFNIKTLRQTNKIAILSNTPLVSFGFYHFEDELVLNLRNYGTGPLIVKNIEYYCKDKSDKNVVKLINYILDNASEYGVYFIPGRLKGKVTGFDELYVKEGGYKNLLELNHVDIPTISNLLKEVKIHIEYKDIFGQKTKGIKNFSVGAVTEKPADFNLNMY